MKVALPYVEAGTGSEVYSRSLYRALNRLGVKAELIPVPRYYEFGFGRSSKLDQKLKMFDVVHANADYGAAFNVSVPLVVTAHHNVDDKLYNQAKSVPLYLYHKTWLSWLQARSFRESQFVIFPSAHSKNSFLKKFPNITNYEVVYNAIKDVKPGAKLRNKGQILVVGGATLRKGADLWPKIMQYLPGYTLLCAGAVGEDSKNIRYLGRVSDDALHDLYLTSEALLSTARVEGFGYSVAEALARRCPVICFKDSPMAELFDDGKEGLYVDVYDPRHFAISVQNLSKLREIHTGDSDFCFSQDLDEVVWAKKIISIYCRTFGNERL